MSELVDSLTGSASPSILRERVNWLLSRRTDDQRQFGILHLDISNFAGINHIYGPSVGDSILVIAADRMRNCVRPSDLVGRLGNDDFQLIFNDGMKSVANLSALVARVVVSINEEYDVAGLKIDIHFDAAAFLIGTPHPLLEQIHRRADEGLALAKLESRVLIEPF
jgi:diguanylate cyclase (GGDEF)-like protein